MCRHFYIWEAPAVHRSCEPFSLGLRQADLKSAIPEAQYIEAAKLPVMF
jgi:hypothetical protein